MEKGAYVVTVKKVRAAAFAKGAIHKALGFINTESANFEEMLQICVGGGREYNVVSKNRNDIPAGSATYVAQLHTWERTRKSERPKY